MDDKTKVYLIVGLLILAPFVTAFFRIYLSKSINSVSFNPSLYPYEAFQISYAKFVPPETAVTQPLYMKGRRAYYQGRFDEAIEIFTQEIAAHTADVPVSENLVRALDFRARVYRSSGRLQEALADYSDVLGRLKDTTKIRDWTNVYYFAGCAYLAGDQLQMALDTFNIFMQSLHHSNAGDVTFTKSPTGAEKDIERAREDLTKALASQPKERILYYCRALAECSLYDWDAALDDCKAGLLLTGVTVDTFPAKKNWEIVTVLAGKDQLEGALKTQYDNIDLQRDSIESRSTMIRLRDLDNMQPEFDYAQVTVHQLMTYNLDGIQFSETFKRKNSMVISRQLLRDGWEFTGSGGSGSAESFATHYFQRPKQAIVNS